MSKAEQETAVAALPSGAGPDPLLHRVTSLSDFDLVRLYQSKSAGDPDLERLAKAMSERGIDFIGADD